VDFSPPPGEMPEGQRGLAIIVKSSWGDARRACPASAGAEGFGNNSEILHREMPQSGRGV